LPGLAFAAEDEAAVRHVVQAFYTAFDDGFVRPVDFATDDWHHINPYGGIDRGLEDTLKTVREVHTTFLKGVTDTPEDIAIRFASSDVAVATVTGTMSPYTRHDGVKQGPQKQVRTFVLVKRLERWLIMQDQNTTVASPPT
jgi:uncharacterized protein (TIGR02246 family)